MGGCDYGNKVRSSVGYNRSPFSISSSSSFYSTSRSISLPNMCYLGYPFDFHGAKTQIYSLFPLCQ